MPVSTPEVRLQHAVNRFLKRQARQAVAALRADRPLPNFAGDTQAMAEALHAQVAPAFVQGGRRASLKIGSKARFVRVPVPSEAKLFDPHGGFVGSEQRWRWENRAHVKALSTSFASHIFRLFFPRVEEAVRRLTFDFCAETNRTTTHDLAHARTLLRAELHAGLEEGEALAKLTKRVQSIFGTQRAYTIARTEAARAMEEGGLLAAEESGVVTMKKWAAAPECCAACQALDGKEVALREPFVVLPGNGPYRTVQTAPLHPQCRCTSEHVVDPNYL